MSRASLLRAFLFIVLRSAQHPLIPRFLQIFRGIGPMPLSLLNHSVLALFAQRTRIPTSARSIGFCAIWVCISSSSSSLTQTRYWGLYADETYAQVHSQLLFGIWANFLCIWQFGCGVNFEDIKNVAVPRLLIPLLIQSTEPELR